MASNFRGVAVTISVSPRQIDDLSRELTGFKNGVPKAISGAINKLLPKGRTEIVDALANVLTVKKNNIRYFPQRSGQEGREERIYIVKSNPEKLEGLIKVLTRKIGLVNFKHTVSRAKGVTFQIYKGGKQIVLRHAFKAMGRSGNVHLWLRKRKGVMKSKLGGFELSKSRGYAGRLPIESLKGLSLLTVYRDHPEIDQRVQDRIGAEMQKELDSQVNRLLKRPARRS